MVRTNKVIVRKAPQYVSPDQLKETVQRIDGSTVKRPHRFRPGTVALREIRKYQKCAELLIPRAAFVRVCKEILHDTEWMPGQRFSVQAVKALQEALEAYLTQLFEDSQLLAIHAGRVTLMARDMNLCRRIRHEVFGYHN